MDLLRTQIRNAFETDSEDLSYFLRADSCCDIPLAPPRLIVIEVLEKSARGGDADAQASLGRLYCEDADNEADAGQALRWFSRAANGGSAQAQAWMANALANGIGVPVDLEAADMWYEQAANKGHPEAAVALL